MKAFIPIRSLNTWLRLKVPIAMLIALFQRTPVIRVAEMADEAITASPVGAVMKSLLAAAASLGAVHSLAGATALSTTAGTSLNATKGKAITAVAFNVTNTINIASWKIDGSIPPGLILTAAEGGSTLTGPGALDATTMGTSDGYGGGSPGNSTTTPILLGTPTQAGTFTFTLQAFEFAGLSGLPSNVFTYSVTVADTSGGGSSGGGGSTSTGSAPVFTTQPSTQSAKAGSSVTFTVAAGGTPAPTYQWQFNNVTIPSVTGTSLTLANVQSSDAGTYKAVALNSVGSSTSQAATLTVSAASGAPVFTVQPASLTIASGTQSNAVFTATTSSVSSLQWFKNGNAIGGQTGSTLTLGGGHVIGQRDLFRRCNEFFRQHHEPSGHLVGGDAQFRDARKFLNPGARRNRWPNVGIGLHDIGKCTEENSSPGAWADAQHAGNKRYAF